MRNYGSSNWSQGSNILTGRSRLPENSIRVGVNIDALNDGRIALRPSYKKIYDGNVTGLIPFKNKLLFVSNGELVEFDARSKNQKTLLSVSGNGVIGAGAELNGTLYFFIDSEAFEYDGALVRRWGVETAVAQPNVEIVSGGNLIPAAYKIAVTYSDRYGREGGVPSPVTINVGDLCAIRLYGINVNPEYKANIYLSEPNGKTLYLQQTIQGGSQLDITLTSVHSGSRRCVTIGYRSPTAGQLCCANRAFIAIADGNVLRLTKPFMPHLVSDSELFYSYPEPITILLESNGSLYVGADKVYKLSLEETEQATQTVASEKRPIPFSGTKLSSGACAWFDEAGICIANGQDIARPIESKMPTGSATSGACGELKHNGNTRVFALLKNASVPPIIPT